MAAEQFAGNTQHFEDTKALQQCLQQELHEDVTCLIKGSRFMQLDKLADQLAEEGEG
jgi:UDP-N-acetylmuramoyl-tripeptide--D-alanyl-D-alanine ligase